MNLGKLSVYCAVLGIVLFSTIINRASAQCTAIGTCFDVVITTSNARIEHIENTGSTNTQARLSFDYEITIVYKNGNTPSNNSCNFNGNFWTLQGYIQHNGPIATIETESYFSLGTAVGTSKKGTATSSRFTYFSKRSDTVNVNHIATGVRFEILGPGINNNNLICDLNTASPLPVELVSFNANCGNNKNIISWSTASEQNNDLFNIYQSIDGVHWELISTQNGNGNSNVLSTYSVEVQKEIAPTTYYRLEQIDFAGRTTQYVPVALNCPIEKDVNISIFPNPMVDVAQIQSNQVIERVRILDLTGKVIETYSNIHHYEFQLLANEARKAGIYIVEIILENGLKTTKKIVQN